MAGSLVPHMVALLHHKTTEMVLGHVVAILARLLSQKTTNGTNGRSGGGAPPADGLNCQRQVSYSVPGTDAAAARVKSWRGEMTVTFKAAGFPPFHWRRNKY